MNQVTSPIPAEKKGRGCFFYGCLSFIILFVLIIAGVYFGVQHMTGKFIDRFADTQEHQLATVVLSPEEFGEASAKISEFRQRVEKGERAEIALTAKELNGLLGMHPAWRDFPGKFEVKISDGKVSGDLSVPLSQYGFAGKFLNGAATLNVGMVEGKPHVSFAEIIVKGEPLPGDFMAQLGSQNLLQGAIEDPEKGKIIRRITSIEARGETIVVKVDPLGAAA